MIKTPTSPFHLMTRVWAAQLDALTIWAKWWTSLAATRVPEIDRDDKGAQLPVPNPIQEAKDTQTFA